MLFYAMAEKNLPILPILSGIFTCKSEWPLLVWNQTMQLNRLPVTQG